MTQVDAHLARATEQLSDDVIIAALTYAMPTAGAPPEPETAELRALRLHPQTTAVPLARRFLADACVRWGLSEDATASAEIVTSELVTNGVLHARTELELRLTRETGRVRIAVADHSERPPRMPSPLAARPSEDGSLDPPAPADALARHGRGLTLVAALAEDWGHDPNPGGGKIVWASVRATR